ncbi:MAG: signal peptidase I [Eubacteriales bacterium]|nr:signal peptidase I [Eubacteriales bacterium]
MTTKKKEMTAAQIIRNRRLRLETKAGYGSLLIQILMFAVVGWLLLTQVLLVTQAKDNEMFPSVKAGDLIIAFRRQGQYVKNDVVVYQVDGQRKVGRVLARETDLVMMDDSGDLLVNGTAQTGEIMYPTYEKEGIEYPYQVPEGSVFILCDYRTNGRDSRDYGAISLGHVEGKVITILRRRGL